ncbi:MAG: hypothetical protein WCB04_10350 [Mycobacteriales bacterium]
MATALVALVAIAGCAGPSRTYDDYQSKAVNTVKAATSALQTARLAVQAQRRGNTTVPYLSVILGQAEENIGSVQGTFDSVQPPDTRADKTRTAVDDLLTQAGDGLSALRIAVRRGQLSELPTIASALDKLVTAMNRFQSANS